MDTKNYRKSETLQPIVRLSSPRVVRCRYVLAYFVVGTAFHLYAFNQSFYWIYRWLDMVVHFLGGTFLALLFFCVFTSSRLSRVFDYRQSFGFTLVACLLFVFVGGVLWEFFELSINHMQADGTDTVSDIFFDLLGGIAIILLVEWRDRFVKRKERRS